MPVDRFDPRLSALSPTLQRIVADLRHLEAIIPGRDMTVVATAMHHILVAWQQAPALAPRPHPVSRGRQRSRCGRETKNDFEDAVAIAYLNENVNWAEENEHV